MTFLDDYSRYTWFYFIKHHFQVPSIYQNFTTVIHTQSNAHIEICIDCGRESLSVTIWKLLASHETLYLQSCPQTHKNGVVERKHWHFLDITWSLLLSASVPRLFGLRF